MCSDPSKEAPQEASEETDQSSSDEAADSPSPAIPAGPQTKLCSGCGEIKPLTDYHRARKERDGRADRCKDCQRIYNQQRIARRRAEFAGAIELGEVPETKRCRRCDQEKSRDAFGFQYGSRDWLQSWCKQCTSDREIHRYQNRDPEIYRQEQWERHIRRNFGITGDEYRALLNAQGGGCAICGRIQRDDERSFPVDHCHTTGAVRGILCPNCNRGLGGFEDDPERMRKAISYVQRANV